jgi:hypothetical protein
MERCPKLHSWWVGVGWDWNPGSLMPEAISLASSLYCMETCVLPQLATRMCRHMAVPPVICPVPLDWDTADPPLWSQPSLVLAQFQCRLSRGVTMISAVIPNSWDLVRPSEHLWPWRFRSHPFPLPG